MNWKLLWHFAKTKAMSWIDNDLAPCVTRKSFFIFHAFVFPDTNKYMVIYIHYIEDQHLKWCLPCSMAVGNMWYFYAKCKLPSYSRSLVSLVEFVVIERHKLFCKLTGNYWGTTGMQLIYKCHECLSICPQKRRTPISQFYKMSSGLYRVNVQKHQGPLLLTWFNFNPSMDK